MGFEKFGGLNGEEAKLQSRVGDALLELSDIDPRSAYVIAMHDIMGVSRQELAANVGTHEEEISAMLVSGRRFLKDMVFDQ